MQLRRPFRPLANGGYRVRLGAQEREALRELFAELRSLVAESDGAVARLFPPAYRDDPEASAAFAELVRHGLESERLAALDTVAATIDAGELDEAQATAWCGVLNDARLVLGERLGVTEELYDRGIERSDPRAPELAFYAWLTWLQGELVEALASRL
jgi:soluble cytochrome b562